MIRPASIALGLGADLLIAASLIHHQPDLLGLGGLLAFLSGVYWAIDWLSQGWERQDRGEPPLREGEIWKYCKKHKQWELVWRRE